MNNVHIKYLLFCFSILFSSSVFSQEENTLFDKIKQNHSEKQFYNSVFKNPALMPYFGKYQFSTVKATYSNSKDEAFLIQKPLKENSTGITASSFYPVDSVHTLWGSAGYKNTNQKSIRWNESIDYNLIYPYFTADSVGGNLKSENYSFLGGYAKSYKKSDFGAVLSYNATLASRDRDPRVENTSSNLQIKIGSNFKNRANRSIGVYAGFQKYTQENNISFFSGISNPVVYHLNGLGFFNNLLRGTNLKAFYDGIGYSFGLQLKPTKNNDVWLAVSVNQLTIDKFLVETLSTQISSVKNRDVDVDLVKLFPVDKSTYGIKFSYKQTTKTGVESVISARSGAGLSIIARNENYNLINNVFELSGLYYKENNQYLFNVSPYINYQKYQEDYVLIRSYQYFDNLNVGLKSNYLKAMNNTVFSCSLNANYKSVLDNKSLLRNDSEVSLSEMLAYNNTILSREVMNINTALKIDYKIDSRLNSFFEIQGGISKVGSQLNRFVAISTGISF